MVFHDFSDKPVHQLSENPRNQFAPPQQRLIASFVDILIFYPLIYLLISPLLRFVRQDFFFGSTSSLGTEIITIFVFGNILLLFILMFVILAFHRTPGQALLHLRVKSFSNNKLTLSQVFQRSLGWIISIWTLGIPLTEILTHPQRFTFYDRISETFVETTEPEQAAQKPSDIEIQLGRWIFLSAIFFICISFTISWSSWNQHEKKRVISQAYQEGELCESISPDLLEREKRLELALVLSYVDEKNMNCLDQEIIGFWFKHEPTQEFQGSQSPQDQITLHHFLNFKEMELSDYSEVCAQENQVCLLISYLHDQRSGKKLPENQRRALIEKLRTVENKHLLTEWILMEEDIKGNKFLAASSRLNFIQREVDGSADELYPLLEKRTIQLAWRARDVLDLSGAPVKKVESSPRSPASNIKSDQKFFGQRREAEQLLEEFKIKYEAN